jgi:CDP-glucose 4,6-dehydratase
LEDVVMFGGAFSGRRVFVTGHTGFKGAWLAAWLLDLGAEVTGYALPPATDPSLFDELGLAAHARHVLADVRDRERLRREMVAARPSVVFHLAAQPLVRLGYAQPHETFETNVMGTVDVLEAVRACESVAAVVVVTSDKCYHNAETGRAFREEDPLGGRDPYSASKGCAELVTAAYRSSFFGEERGAAVASARAGNVIGGGDWAADRIVPDCVSAVVSEEPVVVRNPDAVRPWQHVLESLSGYLWLAACLLRDGGTFAGAWNFGPAGEDAARPVRWVVETFLEEWGAGSWSVPERADGRLREARLLSLDSGKARDLLGWREVWDAATAVRRTAAWYRAFYDGSRSAQALVADQLRAYEAAAREEAVAWATEALGAAGRGVDA